MTPSVLGRMKAEEWTQDGAFVGSDGRPVRCYDDIILSRAIPVDEGFGTDVQRVEEGTICTVLFYSLRPVGMAQLECYVGKGAPIFGYEEISHLRLHMTNEEKYPR